MSATAPGRGTALTAPAWPPPFMCDLCGCPLTRGDQELTCASCGRRVPIVSGIPRFVRSTTHASFALQWKRFAEVQIDSKNGTTESRERLLAQSRLDPAEFADRHVLEVGCGAGRFTEVLLSFGARVAAVDYSEAVEVLAAFDPAAILSGRLVLAQADVFTLPFRPRTFDVVVGYGMLQHTGAPRAALEALWELVRPGGLLLVDRYALDLRHFLPFKYALRPFTRDLQPDRLLQIVERLCARLIPVERALIHRSRGQARRWIRALLGRAPNSTYPLNLEAEGRLSADVAYRWSILETFDQYAPRYDLPCTFSGWRKQIGALSGGSPEYVGSGGQGNVAVVRRGSTAGGGQ